MTQIEYAETTGWEEWMNEYKFGVLSIFPPSDVMEIVNKLRQKYDPKSASIAPAHISLSEPLTSPITNGQLEELRKALESIEPFEMHYGPLRDFPPYPGVTYAITPEDMFMELRELIHGTSIFKNSPLTRKDRAPHMTIAEFITAEETARLMEELQDKISEGSFFCNEIELAVPDKNFNFKRVLKIPLGNESLHH